ncbi:MAG: UDP-2,3-diacylglucosamine diphosphatase LpxI [Rhodospirillales bacterium]|nr:UDP-2,3-diacylglucosamine diphosphatase LpxI [Rhodospirillales bacterium]
MPDKLGIIAGRGDLPRRLIQACQKEGREFHVIAFKGQTDEITVKDVPHDWVRLGAGGTSIKIFRDQGVKELVMGGGISRPSMVSLRPDAWGIKLFAKLGRAALGDDSLLSALVRELENEGFKVVGPSEVLNELLVDVGTLGNIEPDAVAQEDIIRGFNVAWQLGALDVGQAVVVQQGLVLGVEAIEGTEALLSRVKGLSRDGAGGILVKAKKPNQEKRTDLPTIGVATVEQAVEAGLRGIAIEAQGALVIDGDEVVEKANKAGLFIVAIDKQTITKG